MASARRSLARRGLTLIRRRVGRAPTRPSPPIDPTPWRAHAAGPWAPVPAIGAQTCNICHWGGAGFEGVAHSESAICPGCGSIARDRFLFACLQARVPPPDRRLRLLETSPRLGPSYRRAMATWFDYLCSDYDERAHAGARRLDLQAIDLPDGCLDVVLTPHVLEHVPATDAALDELHRVLAAGGLVYLQVPVLQGRTAPPAAPEFHGDSTPVFWRFGFDLTARLRDHGFETALMTTSAFLQAARCGRWEGPVSAEFDVDDMLAAVVPEDLVVVADDATSRRHGFEPGYMFLTWECRKA